MQAVAGPKTRSTAARYSDTAHSMRSMASVASSSAASFVSEYRSSFGAGVGGGYRQEARRRDRGEPPSEAATRAAAPAAFDAAYAAAAAALRRCQAHAFPPPADARGKSTLGSQWLQHQRTERYLRVAWCGP
jgi:hypothetical protein